MSPALARVTCAEHDCHGHLDVDPRHAANLTGHYRCPDHRRPENR